MSYCRLGPDSDVYIYPTTTDGREVIACHACSMSGGETMFMKDAAEMLAHVGKHKAAGDKVPADAISRLLDELPF